MTESTTKQQLNAQLAIEIYKKREHGNEKTIKSSIVALQYGMSPKAIRDIWNRRTWSHATEFLWTVEEREEYYSHRRCLQCRLAHNDFCSVCALHKGPGRPVGSKDTKPRKKKNRTSANMRANSSIARHLKPQESITVHLKADESIALHLRTQESIAVHLKTQEVLTPCFAEPDRTRSPRSHDQEHENVDVKIGQAQSPPPDFDAFFLPEHQNIETDGFDRRRDVIHSELADHMLSGTLLAQEAQDLSDNNLISTSSHDIMRGSAALGTMEDAVGKQGNGVLQQWSNFWPPMLP